MNPIYKFELTVGATTERCYPLYKDDLAKDFEMESNQQFFRAKLSGKLTFVSNDYDRIVSAAFDTQFLFEIFISYNAGQTWVSYWKGTFWKTDCDFDGDAKTVKVTPTVNDQYNAVLAGMEKEYNLIDLLPEIVPVKLDKRPMIQVYVPGQTVIGCFLSGMWWEQECESVLESEGETVNDVFFPDLTRKYHFALNSTLVVAELSGNVSPALPELLTKAYTGNNRFNMREQGTTEFVGSEYKLVYLYGAGSGGSLYSWTIVRVSDNVALWRYAVQNQIPPESLPPASLSQTITLTPVADSGATGNVTLYVHDMPVYARYVLDVETIMGLTTYELPTDDLVENNRNYRRAIGYAFTDTIFFSSRLTSTPTQWGIYQPGQYYQQPYLYWFPELFPIARNGWGRISIWFSFSAFDWITEESGRAPYTLKDAFPLWSVISVLLNQIAPGITHQGTTDYSAFLYGTNPITYIQQTLLITPKSNVISAGYDQPAQTAPITLKNVMDMLRDCFRCYWFIDDQNRFRVEHIQYFRNGGSYSGSPVVGIDLTQQEVPRSGKKWAFARNQFKFDKPEMAARYQFGWMDDVTQLFDGFPINILSKYVNPDNIEQIDVSRFTSDIDYILLNPSEISKDGFVLLSGTNKIRTSNFSFEQGYFRTASAIGTNFNNMLSNASNIIRTGLIPIETLQIVVSDFPTGYSNIIGFFDENGNYLGYVTWGKNRTVNLPTNTRFVCLMVHKDNGGDLSPSDANYLGGNWDFGVVILPYINFQDNNTDHILQNAYVAFCLLQRYYAYDMPAPNYEINGVQMYAQGIKKLKNQSIRFPALTDPDLVELVKTNLGNGVIEKLSVNLSSRNANATLKYDTE